MIPLCGLQHTPRRTWPFFGLLVIGLRIKQLPCVGVLRTVHRAFITAACLPLRMLAIGFAENALLCLDKDKILLYNIIYKEAFLNGLLSLFMRQRPIFRFPKSLDPWIELYKIFMHLSPAACCAPNIFVWLPLRRASGVPACSCSKRFEPLAKAPY